jgi:hypothetical protein
MAKRPSLKGRGADIFNIGEENNDATPSHKHAGMPAQQHALYPKATYYLPQSLQDKLEDVWMMKRKKNRKIKKSDIVREALESYLGAEQNRQ